MTHAKFQIKVNPKDLSSFLLSELDIIKKETSFFEVDIFPDYDKAEYEKGIDKTYYFENSWNFKMEFDSIISAKILNSYAFDFDSISEMERKYALENCENRTEIIKKSYFADKYSYSYFGIESWDSFRINPISVLKIDNVDKKLKYNGSFFGEVGYTQVADFNVYSQIRVEGFKYNIELYNQLIAQSKILFSQKNYNLSYFLTYSALENFINTKLVSEDDENRLIDKLKILCKKNLGELKDNLIYSEIMSNFKHYTSNRNTIAHGKKPISISEKSLYEFFNFVLLIMYINKFKTKNFEELYAKYTNGNNV